MNNVRADAPAPGLAGQTQTAPEASPGRAPPGAGWSRTRWLTLIALVFAAHVALLFVFGARKQIAPRTPAGIPTLKLAAGSDELLALNDPTFFARPHFGGFVPATWSQLPILKRPSFYWTEPPRWLPLSADELVAVFSRFMQTNRFAGFVLQLKPPVKLSAPVTPIKPALAQHSTVRVEGDLSQRSLLAPLTLTNWQYTDVIAPSRVQVLVNETGDVISAILLLSDNSLEAISHYDAADQRALELARAARFAPVPRLTIGQLIFTWHTVPPPPAGESGIPVSQP